MVKYKKQNASRFREALCVLRYRLLRLVLSKHNTLTGGPGGSGHGHSTEAVLVHSVGRYSMTEVELCQGINTRQLCDEQYNGYYQKQL